MIRRAGREERPRRNSDATGRGGQRTRRTSHDAGRHGCLLPPPPPPCGSGMATTGAA